MDYLQQNTDLFGELQTEKEKVADMLQLYQGSKNLKKRQVVYNKITGTFKEIQRGEQIQDDEIVVTKENLPVLEELSI